MLALTRPASAARVVPGAEVVFGDVLTASSFSAAVRASGLRATLVRPWYVLGPGHRWPLLLWPMYALARCFPGSRDTERRLGLVTLPQMTRALVALVETPGARGDARCVAMVVAAV